jgi:Holliday junction DNA helicase RuvA
LFTSLQIKEDAHTLFDLLKSQKERFLNCYFQFQVLEHSQNNVIFIRSKQITNAIASADVVTIQSIKGIGKTAQRVILDLKEKVLLYDLDEVSMSQSNTNRDEALSLEVLGFVRKTSEKIIENSKRRSRSFCGIYY